MSGQSFRCYAYRAGDGYYAECLDLTLLTKRETMQEAVDDLQEVILGYLESVCANSDEKALIPRRVPLYRWLEFYKQLLSYTARVLFTGRLDGFIAYEISSAAPRKFVSA